jgi:hypothetical protein
MAERVSSIKLIGHWVVGTVFPPVPSPKGMADAKYWRALDAARFPWGKDEASWRLALLPYSQNSTLLTQEILLEFVNLNRDDDEEALGFMQKYGVFDQRHRSDTAKERTRSYGSSFRDGPESPPKDVQTFLRGSGATFAVPLHDFWDVQKHIRILLELVRVLQSRDYAAIEAACAVLRMTRIAVDNERDWLAVGRQVLCADISGELNAGERGVSLVATERDGALLAAASSTTLRAALYLALLAQITQGERIGECGNPKCRKLFVLTRDTKRFCSKPCQELEKVNRYRDKLKRQGAKKNAKR